MSEIGAYAGDVSAEDAWAMLREDPDSVLIDVRTQAEWTFVGVPDLSALQKRAMFVPWQEFPAMQRNPDFESAIKERDFAEDTVLLFLCRSGARSAAAAAAMTHHGYRRCYNIAGGFEGDRNEAGHRGAVNGWKVSRLPWIQG